MVRRVIFSLKYVSIPAKKCFAHHENSLLPVTSPVFRYTLADTAKKCGYPQEHDPEVTQEQLHRDIRKEVIVPVLQDLLREDTRILINTTALNRIGIECLSKVLTEQKLHFLNRPCRHRRGVTTV